MGCTTQLFKEGLPIQTEMGRIHVPCVCVCVIELFQSCGFIDDFHFLFLLIYRFTMRRKLKHVSGEAFCPWKRFPIPRSSEMLSPGAFKLCFRWGWLVGQAELRPMCLLSFLSRR